MVVKVVVVGLVVGIGSGVSCRSNTLFTMLAPSVSVHICRYAVQCRLRRQQYKDSLEMQVWITSFILPHVSYFKL